MSPDSIARPNESAEESDASRGNGTRDPAKSAGAAAAAVAGGRDASAVATDEALAREALERLKRLRAKARQDKVVMPRPEPVRPAVIVAKPPPPRPPWVAPLATLGAAVGLAVIACTGTIAYLTIRPGNTGVAAGAEIRNLRETVSQLRRQVSGVSESLEGLRTAVDLSSKTTSDRFGRFAENLDRIERTSSSATAKLDKLAQAQPTVPVSSQPHPAPQPNTAVASVAAAPEFTGSIPSPERASPPRKRGVKGWSVRQAYEGVVILHGPTGFVEAVLGQTVPGLGRIEEIKYENGRPLVLTSAGVILSTRKDVP